MRTLISFFPAPRYWHTTGHFEIIVRSFVCEATIAVDEILNNLYYVKYNVTVDDDSGTYRSIDEIGRVGLGEVGSRMQKGFSPDPLLPLLLPLSA